MLDEGRIAFSQIFHLFSIAGSSMRTSWPWRTSMRVRTTSTWSCSCEFIFNVIRSVSQLMSTKTPCDPMYFNIYSLVSSQSTEFIQVSHQKLHLSDYIWTYHNNVSWIVTLWHLSINFSFWLCYFACECIAITVRKVIEELCLLIIISLIWKIKAMTVLPLLPIITAYLISLQPKGDNQATLWWISIVLTGFISMLICSVSRILEQNKSTVLHHLARKRLLSNHVWEDMSKGNKVICLWALCYSRALLHFAYINCSFLKLYHDNMVKWSGHFTIQFWQFFGSNLCSFLDISHL